MAFSHGVYTIVVVLHIVCRKTREYPNPSNERSEKMSTQTTQTAERVKLVQVLVSFYAFREDDKASNELEHKEKFCVLVNGTQIFSKVVIKTETNSKATLYPVP